jgi:hypothetical protein
MSSARQLRREVAALKEQVRARQASGAGRPDLSRYRDDPIGYARDVLGITLWDQIAGAVTALLKPPYMVSVDSGHGTGKTFSAALIVNWWYDTRNPAWVITTAPTQRDVIDLLWTEVRLQRQRARVALPLDLQPAAPEMKSGPDHVAKGYTARDANSAQGRHRQNMLFVFDEKEGVGAPFWDGMKSMFRPGSGDAVIVFGNPFTTTSRAYYEHKKTMPDGRPQWHRVRLSSLDHPNIRAGLRGEEPPIPGAVTAQQVDQWVADWCDPVAPGDEKPTDIWWPLRDCVPPGRLAKCYRPGPIGEPRILGLRPSAGTYGVWSEAALALCLGPVPHTPIDVVPVVGCDVAGYGDDFTAIHTRAGAVSLAHETGNGWNQSQIADRLREACSRAAAWYNARRLGGTEPIADTAVPINVEDDAIGRGVQERLAETGHRFCPVNAGGSPLSPAKYPNRRSELWFDARDLAFAGRLNLSLLDRETRQRLEQQLVAPTWAPDSKGRRVVEEKKVTKKKLGRSPDDADAMNAAYVTPADSGVTVVGRPAGSSLPGGVSRDWAAGRGLHGMGR